MNKIFELLDLKNLICHVLAPFGGDGTGIQSHDVRFMRACLDDFTGALLFLTIMGIVFLMTIGIWFTYQKIKSRK